MKLVCKCNNKTFIREIEFEDEGTEYKSGRKILVRNLKAEDVIEFIACKMGISEVKLHLKYSREIVEAKALLVLLMRSLCNFRCIDVCSMLGNITQSRVSKLSSIGLNLIDRDEKYKDIIHEFIKCYAS